MDAVHPLLLESFASEKHRIQMVREKDDLANYSIEDFVQIAREHFHEGEILCLSWRVPRRVTKCLSNYVFQVEDRRNENL